MDIMGYLMGQNSAIKKGMKVEVVTELPSTGEPNIVYLVPKQDTGDNDIFDEYLWVDDDWEHIGSTDIDLSNYYTKSEVDAKLPPIYTMTIDEMWQTGSNKTFGTKFKTDLSNIITDAYSKNYSSILINTICPSYGNASIWFETNLSNIMEKPGNIRLYSIDATYDASYDGMAGVRYPTNMTIDLTWDANTNVCTVTLVKYSHAQRINFLSTGNVASYTPLLNYQPATKKYVDDSIASAITDALGGSY